MGSVKDITMHVVLITTKSKRVQIFYYLICEYHSYIELRIASKNIYGQKENDFTRRPIAVIFIDNKERCSLE